MGGLCQAQQQNQGGMKTIQDTPMLTLEDFSDDQKQYVGQLATISRSARLIEGPKKAGAHSVSHGHKI